MLGRCRRTSKNNLVVLSERANEDLELEGPSLKHRILHSVVQNRLMNFPSVSKAQLTEMIMRYDPKYSEIFVATVVGDIFKRLNPYTRSRMQVPLAPVVADSQMPDMRLLLGRIEDLSRTVSSLQQTLALMQGGGPQTAPDRQVVSPEQSTDSPVLLDDVERPEEEGSCSINSRLLHD